MGDPLGAFFTQVKTTNELFLAEWAMWPVVTGQEQMFCKHVSHTHTHRKPLAFQFWWTKNAFWYYPELRLEIPVYNCFWCYRLSKEIYFIAYKFVCANFSVFHCQLCSFIFLPHGSMSVLCLPWPRDIFAVLFLLLHFLLITQVLHLEQFLTYTHCELCCIVFRLKRGCFKVLKFFCFVFHL